MSKALRTIQFMGIFIIFINFFVRFCPSVLSDFDLAVDADVRGESLVRGRDWVNYDGFIKVTDFLPPKKVRFFLNKDCLGTMSQPPKNKRLVELDENLYLNGSWGRFLKKIGPY